MWIWRSEYNRLVNRLENLREENNELYDEIDELNNKIYELREKLSKSGNAYYMKDAAKYVKQYHELYRQNAIVEAQVTKLKLENTYLKKLLNDNTKFETVSEPENDSDYYRNKDGKFGNKDGKSKLEQQKFIYDCLTAGMSLEDIAEDTGLKVETVKLYIGQYEKWLSEQIVYVGNLSEEGYGEIKPVPMTEIKNGVWIKDENFKLIEDGKSE